MKVKGTAGPRPKVLIVEDEIHIQRLVTHLLEKAGLEVQATSDGAKGLQAMQSMAVPPDLVLLDIMMPDVDGLTVLRTMRLDERLKNVPVIMLTAISQEASVKEGIRLGIRDYVRKPFKPKELTERVRKVLGGG